MPLRVERTQLWIVQILSASCLRNIHCAVQCDCVICVGSLVTFIHAAENGCFSSNVDNIQWNIKFESLFNYFASRLQWHEGILYSEILSYGCNK